MRAAETPTHYLDGILPRAAQPDGEGLPGEAMGAGALTCKNGVKLVEQDGELSYPWARSVSAAIKNRRCGGVG